MLQPKKKSNNPADSYPAKKDKRGNATIGGGEGKIPSGPKTGRVKPTMGSAKNGKSFPDLNKDGKITKADILKGRGVIAKKGMTIKKAQEGVQKTKKTSAMRDYVNKYKNQGGLKDPGNIANDTIAGNSPRNQYYNAGFGGGGMQQIKDLQSAFDKKYKGKLDIPVDKNGGKTPKKKMQYGGAAASMAPIKKGGTIKKAMMGKTMMKSGGKMKTCKYGCN